MASILPDRGAGRQGPARHQLHTVYSDAPRGRPGPPAFTAWALPSAISGSLDLGAIATGNARRDKDLRKPRFLDLDRHPVSTFTADGMTASAAGWSVTGYLSVRGTRARLTGDVEVSPHGDSATLTARTQLDRRAVGIRAPKFLIGHQVDITVTATIRRPPDPAPA